MATMVEPLAEVKGSGLVMRMNGGFKLGSSSFASSALTAVIDEGFVPPVAVTVNPFWQAFTVTCHAAGACPNENPRAWAVLAGIATENKTRIIVVIIQKWRFIAPPITNTSYQELLRTA